MALLWIKSRLPPPPPHHECVCVCVCRVFKGKRLDKQMKQKPAWSIEKHRENLENVSQGWSAVRLSLSLAVSLAPRLAGSSCPVARVCIFYRCLFLSLFVYEAQKRWTENSIEMRIGIRIRERLSRLRVVVAIKVTRNAAAAAVAAAAHVPMKTITKTRVKDNNNNNNNMRDKQEESLALAWPSWSWCVKLVSGRRYVSGLARDPSTSLPLFHSRYMAHITHHSHRQSPLCTTHLTRPESST